MEKNFNQLEQRKTIFEEIENIINQSPETVEAEFLRTANTWLDCFIDRLFPIETYLNMKSAPADIGTSEQHQDILNRLEELKERVTVLKEQYPNQDTIPPDDIKEELFNSLKNILNNA